MTKEQEVIVKYLQWFESLTQEEQEIHMRTLGKIIKGMIK